MSAAIIWAAPESTQIAMLRRCSSRSTTIHGPSLICSVEKRISVSMSFSFRCFDSGGLRTRQQARHHADVLKRKISTGLRAHLFAKGKASAPNEQGAIYTLI